MGSLVESKKGLTVSFSQRGEEEETHEGLAGWIEADGSCLLRSLSLLSRTKASALVCS